MNKSKAIIRIQQNDSPMYLLGLYRKKPQFWTLLGGTREVGETEEETLVREIEEESQGFVNPNNIEEIQTKGNYKNTTLFLVDLNSIESFRAPTYIVSLKKSSYRSQNEMEALKLFTEIQLNRLLAGKEVYGFRLWSKDIPLIEQIIS